MHEELLNGLLEVKEFLDFISGTIETVRGTYVFKETFKDSLHQENCELILK